MEKVDFEKERYDVIERIRMLMKVNDMTARKLATELGYSHVHPVSNLLIGNCELRFIFTQRLIVRFPNLN